MSIYGALFAGVSGLNAQSNKLGIISDNIANVNTVGYKGGNASFDTLVTTSGATSAYSPGGVLAGNNQQISTQGLLQSTGSPTDVAISGSGFFVVNQSASGTGQVLYTRAGSFTQDSTGNFQNSAGLFLQAWPLDRNGLLPGEPGNLNTSSSANLSSLRTVNVQDLTGAAAGTSSVSIGANLNASQVAFLGAGGDVKMDASDTSNFGIASKDIIVPSATDKLTSGDQFVVSSAGVNYTYTYGGFTYSRSVADATLGDSGAPLLSAPATLGTTTTLDASTALNTSVSLGTASLASTIGKNTIIITQPSHGMEDGDTVTIADVTATLGGTITPSDINGPHTVTVIDANHYSITSNTLADIATSSGSGGNAGMTSVVNPYATVTAGNGDIIVTQPANGLSVGDTVTLAGATATLDDITAVQLNNSFAVTQVIDANHYKVHTAGSATTGGKAGGTGTITSSAVPFKTTNLSSLITVTQPTNDLAAGDYVTLAGLTSGTYNNIPSSAINNQSFKVASIIDANHFTVDTGTAANATGAFGIGAITSTAQPFSVVADSNAVTVFQPDHGLKTGDVVTLSGNNTDVGSIPANDLNGTFIVTVLDANHYTINTATTSSIAGSGSSTTVTPKTRPFVGNMLDATNINQPFLGVTGTSGFSTQALTFTITTLTTGTQTFTYVPASPNAQVGQFNNMANLAQAINNVSGLSARVINNQLYVSATDSNQAVTIANGLDTGTAGPPILSGIDWKSELGLSDVLSGSNRFTTMQGLAADVNNSAGLKATINNPLAVSDLSINVTNPLSTVTFNDKPVAAPLLALTGAFPFTTSTGSSTVTINDPNHGFTTGQVITLDATNLPGAGPFNGIPKADFSGKFKVTVTGTNTYTIQVATPALAAGNTGDVGLVVTPPNNTGSVLASLGLVSTLSGVSNVTPQTTHAIGPAYDPTNSAKNMASGAIAPQFSHPITVFDALGTGHNLNVAFLKTGGTTWAVEVYAQPATDVTSNLPNGQIANGTVTFNGDGSLRSVTASLLQPVAVQWTNSATPGTISFNWGTQGLPFGTPNALSVGKTDGLSQFNSAYNVAFAKQNGAPVGQLTGVSIDSAGNIIASYNNGETQKLFRIPLAEFADPNNLQTVSGNAFEQTSASGEVNLRQAGTSGVGSIASSQLEASNVELANQLTDMIVAQRAYQANTKVISTADTLLDNLNQILR